MDIVDTGKVDNRQISDLPRFHYSTISSQPSDDGTWKSSSGRLRIDPAFHSSIGRGPLSLRPGWWIDSGLHPGLPLRWWLNSAR